MAVTFDVTPANGGTHAVNTLISTNQVQSFLLTVRSTSNGDNTAVDLRAVDAAYGSVYDTILRELNPLLVFGANAGTGVVHLIMDASHSDAASIAARVGALDGCGTDTACTLGTSITVA